MIVVTAAFAGDRQDGVMLDELQRFVTLPALFLATLALRAWARWLARRAPARRGATLLRVIPHVASAALGGAAIGMVAGFAMAMHGASYGDPFFKASNLSRGIALAMTSLFGGMFVLALLALVLAVVALARALGRRQGSAQQRMPTEHSTST